jgi:hypothetical protein
VNNFIARVGPRFVVVMCLVFALPCMSVRGQFTNGPAIADGLGHAATAGTNLLLVAAAQPGGIGMATAPDGSRNFAGFLHCFQLYNGESATNPASHVYVSDAAMFGASYTEVINEDGSTNFVSNVDRISMQWIGQVGKAYTISRSTNLMESAFVPVYTNTPLGPGVGLWQAATVEWSDTNLISQVFYRIDVQP